MLQAEKKKASLVVPAKFKHHLTRKTEDDRKLFKELQKIFSEEDLSILFGLGVLTGSNKVSAIIFLYLKQIVIKTP